MAVPASHGKPLSEAHATWLQNERKIPVEIAVKAGLYSEGTKLAFPFFANGQLRYAKLRGLDKTFRRDRSGASSTLWRIDTLAKATGKNDRLIITEGEIDALSWMAVDTAWVVSVPDGAQINEEGRGKIVPDEDKPFAWLWQDGRLHPDLDKFARIVLSVDGDEKGRILRNELAVRFGRERCWTVVYPAECKDANDVLVRYGADALRRMLAEAVPLVPDRLLPIEDIPTSPWRGYSSGWPDLDDHLIVGCPELMIITGQPGHGKSQFALTLGMNLARLHGLRGAILQFEDNVERLKTDIRRYAQAWRGQERGVPVPDDIESWSREFFVGIGPQDCDDEAHSLDWLCRALEEATKRHGCKWAIIDPWNEVEHLWDRSQTEAVYTNGALRALKMLARRLDILLMIVAHPTKSGGERDGIEFMSLYDISGAAAFNNKADHGVIVFRPDPARSEVQVKIAKSKDHRRMGVPGTVTMRFNSKNASYEFISKGAR